MVEAVERSNPAALEISHQDRIAEYAEVARCPDHSPRGVEPWTMFQSADVFAGGRKDLNIAVAISAHIIVPRRILFGVRHKQAAADVLHIEGGEALGDAFRSSTIIAVVVAVSTHAKGVLWHLHAVELRIVDFHSSGTEIRDVQESLAVEVGRGSLLSTARKAEGPPFQPEMVPSSVPKMNTAGFPFGAGSTKSVLPLKSAPLGAAIVPAGAFLGGGMVTIPFPLIGMIWPVPVYSVESPELLSETHHGPPELRVSPQGSTRLGSWVGAAPTLSDTRFVCL